jgi:hypothetical protein
VIDWASQNRDRMEAIVTPLTWADWPENARRAFQAVITGSLG